MGRVWIELVLYRTLFNWACKTTSIFKATSHGSRSLVWWYCRPCSQPAAAPSGTCRTIWWCADTAVLVFSKRQADVQFRGFVSELWGHFHQIRFAVIEHFLQVTGLFKFLTVDSLFLFQFLPVNWTLVNGLIILSCLGLFLRIFLFLFHVFLSI